MTDAASFRWWLQERVNLVLNEPQLLQDFFGTQILRSESRDGKTPVCKAVLLVFFPDAFEEDFGDSDDVIANYCVGVRLISSDAMYKSLRHCRRKHTGGHERRKEATGTPAEKLWQSIEEESKPGNHSSTTPL